MTCRWMSLVMRCRTCATGVLRAPGTPKGPRQAAQASPPWWDRLDFQGRTVAPCCQDTCRHVSWPCPSRVWAQSLGWRNTAEVPVKTLPPPAGKFDQLGNSRHFGLIHLFIYSEAVLTTFRMVGSSNLIRTLGSEAFALSAFYTEAQRGEVTCPRSHS